MIEDDFVRLDKKVNCSDYIHLQQLRISHTYIFDTKGRESTCIGLINTKQRLDDLYKEKYDLRMEQSNGIYTVRLRLRN